jgi:hypothetical protein
MLLAWNDSNLPVETKLMLKPVNKSDRTPLRQRMSNRIKEAAASGFPHNSA